MFPSFETILPSLQPALKESQQFRKKAQRKLLRNVLIGLVLWGLFFLSLLFNQSSMVVGSLLAVAFFGMCVLLGLSLRGVMEFRRNYSHRLVGGLITSLFKNITPPPEESDYEYRASFQPGRRIGSLNIRRSKLVGDFTHMSGEDYTSGKIGLTTFEFSEIDLKREVEYKDNDGKKRKKMKKVFKGIVFIADFHKDFRGQTFLVRKQLLGKDKWRLRMDGIMTIDMEDMEFNKTFQTMTTNDIEARYILSSNLMDKIMEFNRRAKGPIKIAFVRSKMYLFTETNKNHFDGKFFENNDEKTLEQIYNDFRLYFDIIEEFTLNRRIWSKK
ncbi:DUF3137 domain-containing protein [Sporosarcina sp. ACRSM]|uniref:DUF3137 domain-containing protein n=1 Tax=Sporosarcina sp. ACRSM TaxID=2918216 RepID=UPI001EF4CD63|nr:DUF3137 domain-containing protein [Sporosarcina sp. ACRSM]MCG7335888.1 DUF3137 domain-containing protein [Sporosarcina sp. ACRSM]